MIERLNRALDAQIDAALDRPTRVSMMARMAMLHFLGILVCGVPVSILFAGLLVVVGAPVSVALLSSIAGWLGCAIGGAIGGAALGWFSYWPLMTALMGAKRC